MPRAFILSLYKDGRFRPSTIGSGLAGLRRFLSANDHTAQFLLEIPVHLPREVKILDGRILPIDLPSSNVVKFIWEDGTSIAVRPSGTEPKLKVYIQAFGKSREKERVLKEWLKVL